METQILKIKDKIVKLADKYKKLGVNKTQDEVKNAFVVFRSNEGVARAEQAYMLSSWSRAWLWMTCRSKRYRDKQFLGKYLSVKRTIDPSLILWENLGYSQKERILRTAITSVVALVLVCFVIAIQVYQRTADQAINSFSPQIQCDKTVNYTQSAALIDFNSGEKQQGLMYCYCKTQYLANPTSVFSIVFSDGKKYCQTWLSKYYLTNVLVIGVPVLIAVANAVAKVILRYMSTLEKQQSVSV